MEDEGVIAWIRDVPDDLMLSTDTKKLGCLLIVTRRALFSRASGRVDADKAELNTITGYQKANR